MKTNQFELPVEKLKRFCNPAELGFDSTADLEICHEIVGQERAVNALRLGLEMPSSGYNIFVTGYVGTGRTTTVKCLLSELEKDKKVPDDIIYVNNFTDPDSPILIRLVAGQGNKFQQAMNDLVESLVKNIPLVLESDTYQSRKNTLVESFKEKSGAIAREFEKKVQTDGFGLMQAMTAGRPELVYTKDEQQYNLAGLVTLLDDKKITKEQYEQLRDKYYKYSQELDEVFKRIRNIEKETRDALEKLEQDTIGPIVNEQVSEIKNSYESNEKVADYLNQVEKEIIANIERFLPQEKRQALAETDRFLDFRVNVLV
ncbi:MAG: AAA family ATPase, partial [Ignavibacteria bacterium]|nr:AAA family ATPase [Ignavibacteria bacterium]